MITVITKKQGSKRKRDGGEEDAAEATALDRKTQRRERRRLMREYFRGSYYGMPAATVVYQLAQQLNKESNDMLWLAIVGLTDYYINDAVSSKYKRYSAMD